MTHEGFKMNLRGEYVITLDSGKEIILPNTIVAEGAEALLKHDFQNVAITDFYIGLCNQVPAHADTLTSITTEPGVVNGYAREVLQRNAVDWPTVSTVNEETLVESKAVTFTAAGGDFDSPFSRLFLCDVASGTAGILFSYSAALASAVTLADTESFIAQYRMYMS
jgi:hypothetical protein